MQEAAMQISVNLRYNY